MELVDRAEVPGLTVGDHLPATVLWLLIGGVVALAGAEHDRVSEQPTASRLAPSFGYGARKQQVCHPHLEGWWGRTCERCVEDERTDGLTRRI